MEPSPAQPRPTTLGAKPNILLILTDQHHHGYLGCLGHPNLRTPSIDRLATESVIFSNAYTPSPVCGPARASLLTGQYPQVNGVYGNWDHCRDDTRLLPMLLRQSGYYSAMVGKLHMSPVRTAHGFDYHRRCDSPHDIYDPNEIRYNDYLPWAAAGMGLPLTELVKRAGASERTGEFDPRFWLGWSWADDAHQMTTWAGNEAVDFLNGYDGGRPFFLHVSFFGPHHPYATCEPWDSMYDPNAMSIPETLHVQQPGDPGGCHFGWPDSLWREMIAKYCGNISAIDVQVGRILEALRIRGDWNNTLIVFTSDHGDSMGEYGHIGKMTMLEGSVRVPLVVKPPGFGRHRQEQTEVVSLLDLHPTLVDYSCTQAADADARSMRRLIEGGRGAWRNEAFSVFCPRGLENCRAMHIREGRKLVARVHNGVMTSELYDLSVRYPDSRNAISDPDCSPLAEDMQKILSAWLKDRS